MRTTGIEWTEHTWNPFVGCTVHSAGCTNCYAMKQANRIQSFGTVPHYAGVTEHVNGKAVWSGKLSKASDSVLSKPFKIKEPSLIFVNSMSDFFHINAKYEWMSEVISIIRDCPQHIFQILTKRPENISKFIDATGEVFPKNAWIGATVERADVAHRIKTLANIPAAVRFISFEPLIGPVGDLDLDGIHWVITGGESGPRPRFCNPEWVREIISWCDLYGVPAFHKQWGAYKNNPLFLEKNIDIKEVERLDPVGKGGSLLDGVHIKNFPHSFTAVNPVASSHLDIIRSQLDCSISIA